MKPWEFEIDIMYDETTPAYYVVRAKIDPLDFVELLERDREVTIDPSGVKQSLVKAVPCGEYGSRLHDAKEGTRGAFWITSCDIHATRPVNVLLYRGTDENHRHLLDRAPQRAPNPHLSKNIGV